MLDAVPVNGKLDLGCHHNQLDTRLPRHDSLDKTEVGYETSVGVVMRPVWVWL